MSKFIVQLLLSVVIGVGAAVGFRSDVRGELNKTFREGKILIGETTDSALETARDIDTQLKTALSVSAKANVKASDKDNVQVDARMKGNTDVQLTTGGALIDNSIPEFSMDSSLNANSQSGSTVNAGDLELDLKNKTKSNLDLGLGLEE